MRQIQPYPEEIEEKMIRYYHSLSEKERRRYAAIDAEKLGYGGISYIVRQQESTCAIKTVFLSHV
jgi:hypothetical protein